LDRIDIHIEVPAVKYKELRSDTAVEDSASVRERVVCARKAPTRTVRRREGALFERADAAALDFGSIARFQPTEKNSSKAPSAAWDSPRARHDRILKVARTIADLDAAANLEPKHLGEAIQYRTLDRTYWT